MKADTTPSPDPGRHAAPAAGNSSPIDRKPDPVLIWNADYLASGRMQSRKGVFSRTFEVPKTMHSSWDGQSQTINFFGASDTYALGFEMRVTTALADEMTALAILLPIEGGALAHSLEFATPIALVGLAIDEQQETRTRNDSYRMTVHRVDARRWRLGMAAINGSATESDSIETAEFELTADSSRPPWNRIGLTYRTSGRGVTTTGDLLLVRAAPFPGSA